MTKTAIKKAMRETKSELKYLHGMEELYNPDWRFTATQCSKRRSRLLKTFWALHAMLYRLEVPRHA